MDTRNSRFNRILSIILIVLYVLTLAAFLYPEWALSGGPWWRVLLNALILSIPLGLLYGSIYVLAAGWREHRGGRQVDPGLAKVIHWAPRLAALLIIFFVSLFSLDVFEMQASPLELLVGFFMHNLPSLAMLALLVLSWKRPAVGFVAFLLAGVVFALLFARPFLSPNLLLFVLPLLLIAGLFYADWKWVGPAQAV